VLELKRSVLLVSTIERKGFDVVFQDVQALIKPRGSSSETTSVLEVRESNLYKLKGQCMRDYGKQQSGKGQGAGSSEG